MKWCREYLQSVKINDKGNDLFATLVAYDLQAGSYVSAAGSDRDKNQIWCRQLAVLLDHVLVKGNSILEVGVGEATTMAGVLAELDSRVGSAFGFDVSWSRVNEGRKWLRRNKQAAGLFVADLMNIPMRDGSVDVVYSSHSLEPNHGKEEGIIGECLRVARKAVLLVEPIYELASTKARARMREHGYVQGLKRAAEKMGAEIKDYRLLEYSPNPLNPSGVLHLKKKKSCPVNKFPKTASAWQCPLTGTGLKPGKNYFYSSEVGLAYPVLRGIPLLCTDHVIVASKLGSYTKA